MGCPSEHSRCALPPVVLLRMKYAREEMKLKKLAALFVSLSVNFVNLAIKALFAWLVHRQSFLESVMGSSGWESDIVEW